MAKSSWTAAFFLPGQTQFDMPQPVITISDVERDIGVAKETLRKWEQRYAFPLPERDALGERVYTPEQLAKLRVLKRLIDRGHRPGKLMRCSAEELALLDGNATRLAAPVQPDLDTLVYHFKSEDASQLQYKLRQALFRLGVEGFVMELAAPLSTLIGQAWSEGRIGIFEEHLLSEGLQQTLRQAIAGLPPAPAGAGPRILLTTLPEEKHGLGLLMAEALFALHGAHCISLGVQTPVPDIVAAARVQRADVVALSFSSVCSAYQVRRGLEALRSSLPPETAIWAGGAQPALQRNPPPWLVVLDLHSVAAGIAHWRQAAPM
jgi:DNA-binding transcriptional MerR regulator/methylmalonyl-CoA mutase cobalamin-binding subunit